MKKTSKKRSASKKANEGGYLLGRGAASKAKKKVQSRKARNRSALSEAAKARKANR